MGKYFSKFPAIVYGDHVAKNIMARPAVIQKAKDSAVTFYDYTLPEEKRADVLSYEYYDHPDYAWLVYLTNGIIDPYTDFYQSDNNLKLAIIKKYGSLDAAYNSVIRWSLNWATDQRELNPVQFEALPGNHKKYWDGVIPNAYSAPYKYVRRRLDTSVETNRVVTVTAPGHTYKPGDIFVGEDVTDTEFRAVVKKVTEDTVTLYHVLGQIQGDQYAQIKNAIIDVANIPADEARYWYPVTAFDDENLRNASKRNISLIDKQQAYKIEKDLKKVLNS